MSAWVTGIGLLLIVAIAWFFWGPKGSGTKAEMTASGYQVQTVKVKGAYSPDTVIVQAGKPVRLEFIREDRSPCSEMVLFNDFQKSVTLPYGEKTVVELLPQKPGTYPFTCQMGMYKGKLVVKE
ncbi:Copper-translocating P-type ATPase [[Clostridium] ultunense Esp]|nr:Copper-translocating P-type ATPase [[Clostridium] ultunense Esp]